MSDEGIDSRSGRLSYSKKDITLQAGAVDLKITRSLVKEGKGGSGLFGTRWLSDWEKRLSNLGTVVLIEEASGIITFSGEPSKNEFISPSGEKVFLDKDGSAVRYRLDGTSERYSADGGLIEIDLRNGSKVKLLYDNSGHLALVKGPRESFIEFITDEKGRAVRIESSTGAKVLYTYSGDELVEVNSDDNIYKYTYDGNGRLVKTEERQTAPVIFTYDGKDRILTRQQSDKVIIRYEYNDDNNSTRITGAGGSVTVRQWNKDYTREDITDPLGNKAVVEYNKAGQPVKITGPTGAVSEIQYDPFGRVVSVKNPLGRVTSYQYLDDTSLIKGVTRPDGSRTIYDYDRQKNVRSIYLEDKEILSYSHTPDGLVEGIRGFGIPEQRFIYYEDGRLKSASDALGGETHYEYDKRGNLIRETSPIGGATLRQYDEGNRLSSVTSPAGLTTRYSYDDSGRLAKITRQDSGTTAYKYDTIGRIVSITLPSGETTSYTYDVEGHISETAVSGIIKERFRYDASGNLIEKTDQWGNSFKYEYNELGKVVKERHPSGLVVSYSYDNAGNISSIEDNGGSKREYGYDLLGQVIKEIAPSNAAFNYKYDILGNLLSNVDPLGNAKNFAYNPLGQIANVREPNNDEAEYQYDPAGKLVSGRRPGGGIFYFKYDAAGNLISEKDPLGNEQLYSYDSAGRLIKRTKASGQSVSLSYDRYGKMTEEKLPDGKKIKYKYDSLGNMTGAGDDKSSIAYRYDKRGMLLAAEYTALRKTIKYEYDNDGFRSRLIMPDGKNVQYEYDNLKRLSAIILPDGKKIIFAYGLKGLTEKIIYPNGVTGLFEYDLSGHVAGITYRGDDGRALFSERYSYNAAGNIIQREDNGGRTVRYSYDPSGQLLEESSSDGAIQHSYGKGGNRAEMKRGSDTIQYKYDAADRMIEAGDETLSYDADGNLVSRKGADVKSYAYDANNRLIKVVGSDSGEVSYAYDASGNRVKREDKKGRTYFIYDGSDLVQELGANLDVQATYVFAPGIDRPVAMLRDGKTFYYHADRLGSIRNLTDERGKIIATYDYDAFGNIIKQDSSVSNPFTYTAREFDTSTELYYYRARYYDPLFGRFLSTDPKLPLKTEPIDLNPYLYVKNSPTRFIDPLGLSEMPPGVENQLWLAENYLKGYTDTLSKMDRGEPTNVPASSRQFLLNEIAKAQAEIEAYRYRFPGIQPQKPSWYVDPPPVPQTGSAPGGGAPPASEPYTTGAIEQPSAPPRGGDTLTVRPGGRGGNTLVAGSEVAAPVPATGGVSGTNIASGVGAGLGTIAAGVNYWACRDEGKSHARCLAELGLGVAVGVGVTAGATAAVAAGVVSAPVVAAGGAVLATAGAVGAGVRWSLAPETKSQMEQQTTLSDFRIRDILDSLDAKITKLKERLNKIISDSDKAAENESKKVVEEAKSFGAEFEKVNKKTNEKVGKIVERCSGIQKMLVKAADCAAQAEASANLAEQKFNNAKAALAACVPTASPIAVADGHQQAASAAQKDASNKLQSKECKIDGIKDELTNLKTDIKDIREEMKKIDEVKKIIEEMLLEGKKPSVVDAGLAALTNPLAAKAGSLALTVYLMKTNNKTNKEKTEEALKKIEEDKAGLLRTVANLKNVLPPLYADELDSKAKDIESIGESTMHQIMSKFNEYETAAKAALEILPSAASLFLNEASLSACVSTTTAAVEGALGRAAQALAKLNGMEQMIAGLRATCLAKLNQKQPAQATLTGVQISPKRVECEEGQTCPPFSAIGVYSDNTIKPLPDNSVTWWPPQPIKAVSQGSFPIKVTHTASGLSDIGQVVIKPKQTSPSTGSPQQGGIDLVASGVSPKSKTIKKGEKAGGFVFTFGYIDYGKPGISGVFDKTAPASCDTPDSPGTYTVTCSAIDPIFKKKYEDSVTLTVLASAGCASGGMYSPKCDPNNPNNPGGTTTSGGTSTSVGTNNWIPSGGKGSGATGGAPTSQPQGYTSGGGKPEEEEPEEEEPQQWCQDKDGKWVPCDATEPTDTAETQPGSTGTEQLGPDCETQCRIAASIAGGLLGATTMGAAGTDDADIKKCIEDCEKNGAANPPSSGVSGGSGGNPPPQKPTAATPESGTSSGSSSCTNVPPNCCATSYDSRGCVTGIKCNCSKCPCE
jgi:RHS repeat-associated protein